MATLKFAATLLVYFLLELWCVNCRRVGLPPRVFNVLAYGATNDGRGDNRKVNRIETLLYTLSVSFIKRLLDFINVGVSGGVEGGV